VGPKRKVRFALQEPDYEGQDGPRGAASGLNQSSRQQSVSTMRSAHDTGLDDAVSSTRVSHRPEETVHTMVPDTALRHKSTDGTVSSGTVTRYDATLLK
jgi:hypothetical protein